MPAVLVAERRGPSHGDPGRRTPFVARQLVRGVAQVV